LFIRQKGVDVNGIGLEGEMW